MAGVCVVRYAYTGTDKIRHGSRNGTKDNNNIISLIYNYVINNGNDLFFLFPFLALIHCKH